MSKTKSIGEKIADTMKDIASIAADAADHAMKAEQPSPKAAERSAAYIPLAADGLVSDPMMVPPIAAAHAPRSKRAASRRVAKASRKTRAKKTVRRAAGKVAKKSNALAIKKRRQNDRKQGEQENEEEREESAQGNSQSAVAPCCRQENRHSKGDQPSVFGQPLGIASRPAAREN